MNIWWKILIYNADTYVRLLEYFKHIKICQVIDDEIIYIIFATRAIRQFHSPNTWNANQTFI